METELTLRSFIPQYFSINEGFTGFRIRIDLMRIRIQHFF